MQLVGDADSDTVGDKDLDGVDDGVVEGSGEVFTLHLMVPLIHNPYMYHTPIVWCLVYPHYTVNWNTQKVVVHCVIVLAGCLLSLRFYLTGIKIIGRNSRNRSITIQAVFLSTNWTLNMELSSGLSTYMHTADTHCFGVCVLI